MDSIIFDLDGTLWDSTPVVARAWTACLREQGISLTITPPLLRSLFGRLLPDIAKALFPDLPEREQLRLIEACCKMEHQALLKTPAPLYEGMEETLKSLCLRLPLFIVSNCEAGYIEVFLQGTKTAPYFRGHLCPGDTGMAKAENIQKICRDFSLKSPVYLGDTPGDYAAAVSAGVPFIHASYGFDQVPDAPRSVKSPIELIDLVLSELFAS